TTKLRLRSSSHRLNQTTIRKANKPLTDLRNTSQRTRQNKRLQRLINVKRLILSRSHQTNQRLTTGNTHGLAGLIVVIPATIATVISTPVSVTASSPTTEQ